MKGQTYAYRTVYERSVYETRKTADGLGHATDKVGTQLCEINLVIDLDSVARQLGRRAASSKSGKATQMAGALVVKVTKRDPIVRTVPLGSESYAPADPAADVEGGEA